MRTVSNRDHWVDDHAEDLLGLPIAEVVSDVFAAGFEVQVWWPGDWHFPVTDTATISLTVNVDGVVTDIRAD